MRSFNSENNPQEIRESYFLKTFQIGLISFGAIFKTPLCHPITASSHIFNAITVGELVLHIYIYINLALSTIRYPYIFRYLS